MADPTPQDRKDSPRTESRTIWWVILGLTFVWCAYLYVFGPRPRSGAMGPPLLRSPSVPLNASYDWALEDLDGKPLQFDRYKGKTVFLNLWATWCPPCVAELPSIASLAANPRLKNVEFLCVSLDDNLDSARQFVRDKAFRAPVLHTPGDPPSPFLTDAIPATFIITADGRVAVLELGAAQWDDPSVVDYLEKLSAASDNPEADTLSSAH